MTFAAFTTVAYCVYCATVALVNRALGNCTGDVYSIILRQPLEPIVGGQKSNILLQLGTFHLGCTWNLSSMLHRLSSIIPSCTRLCVATHWRSLVLFRKRYELLRRL